MSRRRRESRRAREKMTPAWCFYTWWDDAVAAARMHALQSGRRHAVRASEFFPGLWVVMEAGA